MNEQKHQPTTEKVKNTAEKVKDTTKQVYQESKSAIGRFFAHEYTKKALLFTGGILAGVAGMLANSRLRG